MQEDGIPNLRITLEGLPRELKACVADKILRLKIHVSHEWLNAELGDITWPDSEVTVKNVT